MNRSIIALLFLLLPHGLFGVSAQAVDKRQSSKPPAQSHQSVSADGYDAQAFNKEVKGYADLLRLPGLSVAVVHDGRIIDWQRVGYADFERKTPIGEDQIFWLSSVTKTFSAVMMMQYEREGELSADDPLIRYPFASVGFSPQRINSDVRLKHVLSHTSEGNPGDVFVYHGGRYNFIYGVFEQMSGLKFPQAFHHELNARIIQPLKLEATLAGYPGEGAASLRERVVTPYRFDPTNRVFAPIRNGYGDTAYPATGLLSSVKDLAAYTGALDDGRLLPQIYYERMNSPFVNNKGQPTPHGFGWFTQRFAGVRLHWAYGLGDSDSSILLRVPERRLTLILLSNSDFACAPSRLGGGDALRSPFVISFLKHFVLRKERGDAVIDHGGDVSRIKKALSRQRGKRTYSIHLEELFTQALVRQFAESKFNTKSGQPEALLRLFYELHPQAFTRNDPALIHLLSQFSGANSDEAANLFIKSYTSSGVFHPWILQSIAKRYESKGDAEGAVKYYHILADAPGFEEQGKIEACSLLAKHYAREKDFDRARKYIWRALVYSRQTGSGESQVLEQLDQINRLAG